jgi:hypothetical protein
MGPPISTAVNWMQIGGLSELQKKLRKSGRFWFQKHKVVSNGTFDLKYGCFMLSNLQLSPPQFGFERMRLGFISSQLLSRLIGWL